jgi:hypothetical protein
MSFIDEIQRDIIITYNDKKFITEMSCRLNLCESKTNRREDPKVIAAIFDALDSYGVEGIDTSSFLRLMQTTITNVQTKSYGETYVECITMLIYMFQDIGMCRLESNILKYVPEDEQKQASQEFKKLQALEAEL